MDARLIGILGILCLPMLGGAENGRETAEKSNRFGEKLLRALPTTSRENVLISPPSVYLCLTGLVPGSVGSTEKNLTSVLGFQGSSGTGLADARTFQDRFAPADSGVLIANAIWTAPDLALRPEYLREVKQSLNMDATRLKDLKSAGLAQINGWVAEHTRNRIPTILEKLSQSTAVVLTNAVCFDGLWTDSFDPKNTKPRAFRAEQGSQDAPTMNREGRYGYAETDGIKFLRIPYRNHMSMEVALPAEGADPETAAGKLFDKRSYSDQQVDLRLPKFSFSDEHELEGPLSKMGLEPLFHHADLSRMSAELRIQRTRVSRVVQKTWIEVDEKGTKAAAATAITVQRMAIVAPPRVVRFYVDHPFAFAIRDDETNAVLFLGAVRRI